MSQLSLGVWPVSSLTLRLGGGDGGDGEVHSSRCQLKATGRLLGAGETSPAGPPCPFHRRPDAAGPKMLVLEPHCIEYSSGWRHYIPA